MVGNVGHTVLQVEGWEEEKFAQGQEGIKEEATLINSSVEEAFPNAKGRVRAPPFSYLSDASRSTPPPLNT